MLRSRLLASSALAVLLLLGACSAGSGAAVTVDDEEIGVDRLDRDIDAMLARPEFFAAVFQFCPTATDPTATGTPCPAVAEHPGGTYPQAVASFAIRQRVFFTAIKQELARQAVAPTDEDRTFVDDAFAQQLADGRTLRDLMQTDDEGADEAFVNGLIDDFSAQVALQNLFPDEATFNAFVAKANLEVSVNSRYGTWNPQTGALDPPDGPAADPASVGFTG